MGVRKPRLVRITRLTAAQFAHFATPKTWAQIFALEPRMRRCEVRDAIVDADEHGRGFLCWTRDPTATWRMRGLGTWSLTAAGADYVAFMLGAITIH